MDDLLGCTDVHQFAKKYSRHGAVIRSFLRGDIWVRKVFLNRCPVCFSLLPSMLTADGVEACVKSGCGYQRRIFSYGENANLGGVK